ncbi:MAG: DUF3127 domain-containing protein [Chitinophagaceae bacterium]|nr:DUF3127 domain-containing protein [Chitinophagaceae bacterium]MCW5903959.1 DUF3127 domain-containing protein [Chitinophagaceae bacterium]
MSFEITGKLIAKFDTVQHTETFKTREFVIEKTEDAGGRSFTNYIKFQCVQDRVTMPDRFNIGEEIKVSFNVKGTKWNKNGTDNYITNLSAWRIETVKLGEAADAQDAPPDYIPPAPTDEIVDDLPF